MSGSLVRIRSYLTVWEADWQHSLLADAGIPSCVDNGAVVLWAWHYTQAVGGVKLYIDHAQLDEAAAVLAGSMPDDVTTIQRSRVTRNCPQCGAEFPADWDVCWRCSPVPEISVDLATEDDTELDSAPPIVVPVALAFLLTWVVIRYGLVAGAVLFALIVAVRVMSNQFVVGVPSPAGIDPDAAAPDPPGRTETGDSLALRAWRAAVFGCLWFPPLLLYSLYLTVSLGWRRLELSVCGRAHFRGAIATMLVAGLTCGFVVAKLMR